MKFRDVTKQFRKDLPDPVIFSARTMSEHQCSKEEADSVYDSYMSRGFRVYENGEYIVMKIPMEEMGIIRLSIQNMDKSAKHDWRDFQEIKNTLIGPEHEAAELYPAESRKHDIGNAFHLFVLEGECARFPFGAEDRRVSNHAPSGYEQRQLPDYDPESIT